MASANRKLKVSPEAAAFPSQPDAARPRIAKRHSKTPGVLRGEVLAAARDWTVTSKSNHAFVKLLEDYKLSIKKMVSKTRTFESTLEQIRSATAASAHVLSKREAKLERKVAHQKEQKRAKDARKVWAEFDPYFVGPDPELVSAFGTLRAEVSLDPGSLLNMRAVNRLAAIGKMVEYCRETKTELRKFGEGRVAQRVRAWLNMRRQDELGAEGPTAGKERVCCPDPEELDYLRSLNVICLEEEVANLKRMLAEENETQKEINVSSYYQDMQRRNRQLWGQIETRMQEALQSQPQKETDVLLDSEERLLQEYERIVPEMQRKREHLLRKERKLVKLLEETEWQPEKIRSESTSKSGSILGGEVCDCGIGTPTRLECRAGNEQPMDLSYKIVQN